MPGKSKDFQSLLKDHFSRGGEVPNQDAGNRLTIPDPEAAEINPKAGISVGWVQRDLAHARDDRRKVVEFLTRDPALAGQTGKLENILGKKASELSEADRTFLNNHETAINERLGSEEGKKVLNGISAAQARRLEQKVNELARDAGPDGKAFLNSTEGRLRIADYMNQFGTSNEKLKPFLNGEKVTLDDGKTEIRLDGPLTVEKWREYVGGTRHGAQHPKDVTRRFQKIDEALKRQGIEPDAPRRAPKKSGTEDGAPGDEARAPGGKDADAATGKDGSRDRATAADNRPGDGRNLPFRPGTGDAPDLSAGTASPEARKLRAFATEPPTGTEAILLKPTGRVTEGEMLNLMRDPAYRSRASALPEAVRRWHVNFFGTGPVPRDVTGRQIDAPPIRPIPTVPTRPIAADGGDLIAGIGRIAAEVALAAGNGELAPQVSRLQTTLNDLDARAVAGPPPLRRDGIFGPLTRTRLRRGIAGFGTETVRRAFRRAAL